MPCPVPSLESDIILAIQLYRSPRIGSVGYHKLCAQCDSFEEALEHARKRAIEVGDRHYQLAPISKAEREFEKGQQFGAEFIASGAEEYPDKLLNDPSRPPFLWCKGSLELLKKPTLAIIGSRNPTIDGVRIAAHLSKLSSYEGIVIVSGLARGIDAVAHEAALNLGTIGVVAGGVDVLYPKSNSELQQYMYEGGLVVSEMPFGHPPTAKDFPKRNRIIAGLSLEVLVIEATLRSGTKITVNEAEKRGRGIMAVPGHPTQPLSALPNELITNGATLIRNVDDILNSPSISSRLSKEENDASSSETPQELIVEKTADDAASLGRAIIQGRATAMPDGRILGLEED